MDTKVRIQTPENIELEYELAGIGMRLMAFTIDSLILGITLYYIFLILEGIGVISRELDLASTLKIPTIWITALTTLIFFLISAGYFMIFEALMHGQTPGKKLLKIRVMKDDGELLGFFDSMIRNTLRIVDLLPGNYAVGVISIFLSSQGKRIGDYVAGTVMVKEKRPFTPQEIKSVSSKIGNITRIDIDRITPQEYDLIREFLTRKDSLPPESLAKIATTISLPLMEKLKVLPTQFPDHTSFLIHLYDCYKRHSKLMFLWFAHF